VKCPFCASHDNGVVDSRLTAEGNAVRRRRQCSGCERRFTTYERIEEVALLVVKKDGRRQTFDRGKLMRGLQRACEKRPVSTRRIEQAVTDIERAAHDLGEREIPAPWIGERVMDTLRLLDEVAYVRFASVYRSFRDVEEFARELESLRAHVPAVPVVERA
jgi:transcriptional repressor NrdR